MSYVTVFYRMDTSVAIWSTQKKQIKRKKTINLNRKKPSIALLQITMFVPKFTESKASP